LATQAAKPVRVHQVATTKELAAQVATTKELEVQEARVVIPARMEMIWVPPELHLVT
jgi:hypothetical protein